MTLSHNEAIQGYWHYKLRAEKADKELEQIKKDARICAEYTLICAEHTLLPIGELTITAQFELMKKAAEHILEATK